LIQGNSLFAFAYQGVDMAFNSLAGVLVVMVGAVSLYLIDSITFAIAAILFSQIRIPSTPKANHIAKKPLSIIVRQYLNDLGLGTRFIIDTVLVRLLIGAIIINFVGGATFAVLPAYGAQLGGPEYYGALLAAQAIGSLIGSLSAPMWSYSFTSRYFLDG
jgi:hypothetical protein